MTTLCIRILEFWGIGNQKHGPEYGDIDTPIVKSPHWHWSDGRRLAYRLVRDGNSAAVPPIAAALEFGGMSKTKESPLILGHSNIRKSFGK